jgi:tetratricopeptide (TPR) repeat protein
VNQIPKNQLLSNTSTQKARDNYLVIAERLKQLGKLEEAISYYRQEIAIGANLPQTYYALGEVFLQLERVDEAIEAQTKAASLLSQWFKPYYSLGIGLEKKGCIVRAIESYQKAIELNTNFAWSYYNLANIYARQGAFLEAEINYQKAIEVHPPAKSGWFYFKLGKVCERQGKIEAALSAYEKASELNQESLEIWLKLGSTYTSQRKWSLANQAYRQAIKIDRKSSEAHLGIGIIFEKQEKYERAINFYRKVLTIQPNHARAYQKLQQCSAKINPQLEPELQKYYDLIVEEPNNFQLYFQLAKALSKKGIIDRAIEAYLKTIEIQPNFLEAYEDLINISLYYEDLEITIPTYREVIKKLPTFIPAYKNLAYSLTQQNKPEEAIEIYQKAVRQKTIEKYPDLAINYWESERRNHPNFIIIGSEKCGTSSLHTYIDRHPQVVEAIEKEIHYFSYNFDRGINWYLAHFPRLPQDSNYITGEASTSYIGCHNNAPQRTFELLPEVKLLAVFRNPIDRAISHYHQLVRLGRENRSLETVIKTEIDILRNIDNPWSSRQNYWRIGKGIIWHSLYFYFIEKWLKIFPQEQILILRSEDLFGNTQETMKQVFKFLNLPNHKLESYPSYNAGGIYEGLEVSLREEMEKFFQPHNQKLQKLTNISFNW